MIMCITIFSRLYHNSGVLLSIKKQGIKLCKMVNPKSKKQWYQTPMLESSALPTVKSLTKTKNEPGKQAVRRKAMLNKLFMKYITDIMSTGTGSINIVGRGIEISKVHISSDFQTLNVYWICKGTAADEEIQLTLNRTAGAFRHELSTLRLMGEVPYIVFVKDPQESMLVDLDTRLSTADYGEDYTPTDIGHLLKTEFTLNMKLSPEMQAKIKQLEEESPLAEEQIPEMTHNVYGLEHAKIMNRLLAARKKTQDAWSSIESDNTVISYRTSSVTNVEHIDTTKQKRDLAEFLHKRQVLQNKLVREMRKPREDVQVEDEHNTEAQNEALYEEEEEFNDFDERCYDDRPNLEYSKHDKNK